MAAVINSVDSMGPKEDKAEAELNKARIALAAAEELFPLIALSVREANRRRMNARMLSLFARVLTVIFSAATLIALGGPSITSARWLAIGSVATSLITLFEKYFSQLGGDRRALTAEQALTKLVELDFELRKTSLEISGHVERGAAGKPLNDCVNRTNGMFKEVNTLRTELGIVHALNSLSSLKQGSVGAQSPIVSSRS
jgi:hypothetical protein